MYECIVAAATHFTCEEHNAPGACTQECLDMQILMASYGAPGQPYDPTGCRYVPEPREPDLKLRTGGVFVTFFEIGA